VKEVYYQKSLVHLINQNARRISIILFSFSVLLLIIAIALINNTIRLSVYSKRFLIRSMQLVGATENFIQKPFIISGIIQGFAGALIALAFLSGIIYLSLENIPELLQLQDFEMIGILFGGILLLGMLLTGISTYFALNKYLRIRTDKLFA
jgi:cell division transport system permease protein